MKQSHGRRLNRKLNKLLPRSPRGSGKYTSLISVLKRYEEFILNTSGKIISSNLVAANVTGYDEWKLIGKSIYASIRQEDRDAKPSWTLRGPSGRDKSSVWRRLRRRTLPFGPKVKSTTALHNPVGALTGYGLIIRTRPIRPLCLWLRDETDRSEYFNLFNNTFTGIFKFRMVDFRVLLLNDKALQTLEVEKPPNRISTRSLPMQKRENFTHLIQCDKQTEGFSFLFTTVVPRALGFDQLPLLRRWQRRKRHSRHHWKKAESSNWAAQSRGGSSSFIMHLTIWVADDHSRFD